MLKTAIDAKIPMIETFTRDMVNVQSVLEHLCEHGAVERWHKGAKHPKMAQVSVLYVTGDELAERHPDPTDLYDQFVSSGMTLVILNPTTHVPSALRVGEVPVPSELVDELLENLTDDPDPLKACLGGLTLKEIGEVIQLASTQYKEITPDSLVQTRRHFIQQESLLSMVDTTLPLYQTPPEIEEWVQLNKPFFGEDVHPKLVPRGLLLKGPSGTGKTVASKHIASEWGVPLYRVDLGSLMGKYVGESEQNLTKALAALDHSAPCIALFDEVEKIFAQGEDSGVVHRMLSQILWWLQEHKSLVLTVMTTNDDTVIPPELIRPGRIDQAILLEGMTSSEGHPLMRTLFESLTGDPLAGVTLHNLWALAICKAKAIDSEKVPPAVLEQVVISHVKKEYDS